MYPKKGVSMVSNYPSIHDIQVSMVSKYPDIRKKWYPLTTKEKNMSTDQNPSALHQADRLGTH